MRQVSGTLFEPQSSHPGSNRARANNAHFASGLHQIVQLLGQRRDALLVEQPFVGREDARADLHDPDLGRGGNFVAKEVGHWEFEPVRKAWNTKQAHRRSNDRILSPARWTKCFERPVPNPRSERPTSRSIEETKLGAYNAELNSPIRCAMIIFVLCYERP